MFERPSPRLYGLPPGADFAREVVDGLTRRLQGQAPEALAKVTLLVNTRRMQRRMLEIFGQGPARLLPRVRLITDLAFDPAAARLPLPVPPLRRRLELSQLVSELLVREPDLAPRAALFDLSDSLARLIDEMQGEGVSPEVIAGLDVTDQSGHWARSLQFLGIAQRFFGSDDDAPDVEARQRMAILQLIARWGSTPPADPVIVAGSTGSRGTTALLIDAVARLPLGAVILPGFDSDLSQGNWDRLDDAMTAEDHPQFRFRRIMDRLGLTASDVQPWQDIPAPCPARNKLISLSLLPAPVTDQWRSDGPALGNLDLATRDVTLIEAPSPRAEAEVIALRLRQAVAEGITAALITPDRGLTRQVAAALDRWHLVPDDSAGVPLSLSPPGRFLRQVADLAGQKVTAEALLSLLKHPLCHSDGTDRGQHLLRSRELELSLRRYGPPFPDATSLAAWANRSGPHDAGRVVWAQWLGDLIERVSEVSASPLSDLVSQHLTLAEALAAGPGQSGAGELWDAAAGRVARDTCADLVLHAPAGGTMSPRDYAALFASVIGGAVVRDRDKGHPQILIWGTLEARVQGADLVILGGMNEGIWPETPAPDPWLNRSLRQKAGLLLPERRIGLSAHDYMQAVAGREVWITRALRSADAETVPSRWINRLTNLLGGLPAQGGQAALTAMRTRGSRWLDQSAQISAPDAPTSAAPRPSPRPPRDARPKQLSVTQIKTLIRDPYAIYAAKVLRLAALDPLTHSADAPLRGTIIHRILERFIGARVHPDDPVAQTLLLQIAAEVLEVDCPWPMMRRMWLARIARVAPWFLSTESGRQALATPAFFEEYGTTLLADLDFTLTAKADRLDIAADGSVWVYDYKTGTPPTAKEQGKFDKQLLLEAAMINRGAFASVGARAVAGAAYIGLGAQPKEVMAPLADHPPEQVWTEFRALITRWHEPGRGYSARMAMQKATDVSDYDQLARFGEWDQATPVTPQDLT